MSWFNDVDKAEVDDSEPSLFEVRLQKCLEAGAVEDISLPVLSQNIGDVVDTTLLRNAYAADERDPAANIYSTRLEELGSKVPTSEDDLEEMEATEEAEADAEEEELPEEPEEAPEEEEAAPEPTEAVVEATTATAEVEVEADGGSTQPEVSVDLNALAPGAVPVGEAAKRAYRWMVMVWADPGEGKTFFSHTAPGPICFLDTEGKAHDIADKFTDKDLYYWQPSDYWEAVDALDEALEVLGAYHAEGVTGTLVVDSMSIVWEWAQTAYKKKYYPNQDPADVTLKSGLAKGGGDPDWPEIKAMHNDRFRERMVNSPYHLVWTAMRQDDYKPVFEGEGSEPVDKPGGEKNNIYKVNHILRIERNHQGIPVARLTKSGRSKYNFRGLPFPTWETFTEAVEKLSEQEESLSHGAEFELDSGLTLTAALGEEEVE